MGCATETDDTQCTISCNVNADGSTYTSAPTPATTDNSTQIATTAYTRNYTSATYLPLTGGVLNGSLRINLSNASFTNPILRLTGTTNNSAFQICNDVVKGTAPSTIKTQGIEFYGNNQDTAAKRLAHIDAAVDTTNTSKIVLGAYGCSTATNTTRGVIEVGVRNDNSIYTSAPTPATSDNSTQIATTAFVNNFAVPKQSITHGTVTLNADNVASSYSDYWYANGIGCVWICVSIADNTDTQAWKDYPIMTLSPVPKTAARSILVDQSSGLGVPVTIETSGVVSVNQKGVKFNTKWLWGGLTFPINV